MWPAIYIQPNIAYLIRVFSWHYANLGAIYSILVTQIFQYLADSLELDIIFKFNAIGESVGYTNFN